MFKLLQPGVIRVPGLSNSLLLYVLIFIHMYFLTSCNTEPINSKHHAGEIGFSGFYLDMDYLKVNTVKDSLLKTGGLYYFETTDMFGNTQENLYYDFSGVSTSLCAKVNLRGSLIVDQRLNSIQLTLHTRLKPGDPEFSYNVDLDEVNKLFELYKEKYGKPTLLGPGEQYNWLEKKLSNVYFPGPEGRLVRDKIFFWEKGNYIIYFDFGYPEASVNTGSLITEPAVSEAHDSTITPIIYFDFTQDYIDRLLQKAGKMNSSQVKDSFYFRKNHTKVKTINHET